MKRRSFTTARQELTLVACSAPLALASLVSLSACSGNVGGDAASGIAADDSLAPVDTPAAAPVAQPGLDSPPAIPTAVEPPPAVTAELEPPIAEQCSQAEPLPRRLRALNGTQYANTLREVFPSAQGLVNPHSASDRSSEFSTSSSLRRFDFNTSQLVRENGRRAVAGSVVTDLQSQYACLAEADSACVRTVGHALTRSLYREPVDEAHVDKLVALFDEARAKTDVPTALGFVVRAMLSSPRFLFRSEMGAPDPAAPEQYRLTPHEVASAIAYTLSDSPPDEALSAAADSGALADPAEVRRQAERMLSEGPASRSGLTTFMGEYLATADFPLLEKDPALFPEFDEATQSALFEDFRQTVDAAMTSESPTFEALLTGKEYVVRPETARLLGLENAEEFSPDGTMVTTEEPDRMGLLTHPVFLATYSHLDETNPVARGHFISGKVLCIDVPSPPEAVVFPERVDTGEPQTLRQVLETQHSVNGCEGCHRLMDPMGFPFESFDALGRVRELDNGLPIDTSGAIVGSNEVDGPVANASELLTRLSTASRAKACFATRAYKYVAGIDSAASTPCATEAIEQSFDDQGNVPELFIQLLLSDGFRVRTAEIEPAP